MRYKEYNKNRVLEKSITLFWKQGFKGCSISNLVTELGVNRFSLYHEFDNKEGILYESLQLYEKRYCAEKLSILDENGNVENILRNFYFSFLDESNLFKGCYFIHIGTEMADHDSMIKKILDEYLKTLYQKIVAMLMRNDFEAKMAELLGRHLVGLYCTTMSFCLIHTKEQQLQHINNGIQIILGNYDKSITKFVY